MTMTGINGKINNSKNIIIFDESIKIDQIQSKINNNSFFISSDYKSYQILKKNNASQVNFDDYLSSQDLTLIQKTAYELSDWFKEKNLSSHLLYENVNLGSLLQSELIYVLVNFLKNFYCIHKISKKFPNSKFFSSKNFSSLLDYFSLKHEILDSYPNDELLPLDDLNTNVSLKFKNINVNLKFNKKKLDSLRSITENIANSLINSDLNNNSKKILFSEFDTKKYSNLFKKMPFFDDTYVLYNRRRPSIWDKESYSIIKDSKSIIENEKSLKLDKKNFFKNNESKISKILENIQKQDHIFEKIFIIEKISFWSVFKKYFIKLLEKRFFDYSYEVNLSHKLVNKYDFSSIILLNEVGPNEKILLQIGHSKKIPIVLLQHGLIFDTNEALTMNKYQGVLGSDSDYIVVWGDIDEKYRKNIGMDTKKIIKIGSPIYDNFNQKNITKNDHILLATSGPTTEDIFDLKLETISKNISTIKKISEIISSMNKKLIIKIHPSPHEYDPSKLVKSINPKIDVIKSGNISELIKNCSLMILIDFSTVVLDAYVLNKPIISLSVKDNGYGLPTALIDNSILVTELSTLEQSIKKVLTDSHDLLIKSKISRENYLSNIGNSSEKLLEFLSNLSKI